MRSLLLSFVLASLTLISVRAQEADVPDGAVIAAIEISGISRGDLSPGLRRDLDALPGTPLSRDRLRELATRIEMEQPEYVAATRGLALPDGSVRVVFLAARISEDANLNANINARYIVDAVEIAGVPESSVSQSLRDDMQKLVGARFTPEDEQRLVGRLKAELPDHIVNVRTTRGSEAGHVRVVFEVSELELPWIRFSPSRSKLVYHSLHGVGGVLDVPLGGPRHHRITAGLIFGDDDEAVEEQTGYRLRLESRRLGTDVVGASFELSQIRQQWDPATLSALEARPDLPGAYRERLTVEPNVTVAFNPGVRIVSGVSVSELESWTRSPASQMANAWVVAIGADRRWGDDRNPRHAIEGRYQLRAGRDALGSDLEYTRQAGTFRYRSRFGENLISTSVAAGHISGQAPLFERFVLGDSVTLRGWNRLDVAPVGGDRMVHHSIEYRHRGVAFFLDQGSVWDEAQNARYRVSTGIGFYPDDSVYLMLGAPLNADEVSVMFLGGVRF